MRLPVALAAAALVLLTAVAPHVHHAGPVGTNACQACVVRAGEEASTATPDLSPAAVPAGEAAAAPAGAPAAGFPLGAVPGQSPPRA